MIVRASGGNRELRFTSEIGPWRPQFPLHRHTLSSSGDIVSVDDALGLPAVLGAVRLIAETIASLPMEVWQGRGAEKKLQDKTWQYERLHTAPSDEQSAFDFWLDVAASVETYGNAYVRKVKGPDGRVETMFLLDPWSVRVYRDQRTAEKVFLVRPYGTTGYQEYGTGEILHVRGLAMRGADWGMSPIEWERDVLGSGRARSKFEGNLYNNNAAPPGAIVVPGRLNDEAAERLVARWKRAHAGVLNAGNPAVLSDGAKWETFGLPLKDVQFIEANGFLVEDVARMFNVPASLLQHNGPGTPPNVEQDSTRFLNFGLNPRLKRIEQAVLADPDFFGVGSKAYPLFCTEDFIRADAATQAQVRHFDVQSGVLLPDEARAERGLPPLPPIPEDPTKEPGKVPQITPVGGAPNALTVPAPADTSTTKADENQ